MEWEVFAEIAGAIGAVFLALHAISKNNPRISKLDELKKSIDVYQSIPESWNGRKRAEKHIEVELELFYRFSSLEDVKSQENEDNNVFFFFLGTIMTAIAIYLLYKGNSLAMILLLLGAAVIKNSFENLAESGKRKKAANVGAPEPSSTEGT